MSISSIKRIRRIEKGLGLRFKSKRLPLIALTHPSYQNSERDRTDAQTFQRLEFLGDAVLNYFIVVRLYKMFPHANEGLLSRLRSILVSRKMLAKIAKKIALSQNLLLSEGERKHPNGINEKVMADSFEALLAAIYFDRGLKQTESFLGRCFKSYLNQRKLFRLDPNSKSALQEFVQKNDGRLPVYRMERKKDFFIAWVSSKRTIKARGVGRTKQEAEVQAAAALLKKLLSKTKKRKQNR
jgi:ribonuclease III